MKMEIFLFFCCEHLMMAKYKWSSVIKFCMIVFVKANFELIHLNFFLLRWLWWCLHYLGTLYILPLYFQYILLKFPSLWMTRFCLFWCLLWCKNEREREQLNFHIWKIWPTLMIWIRFFFFLVPYGQWPL